MNWKPVALAALAVALPAPSFAGAPEAEPRPVAVRLEGLPPHVARKVQEKARQGPRALRQYVFNTRMVNGLDFRSLTDVPGPRR